MMRAQTRAFPWRFRVLLLGFVLCIGLCIHKTLSLNMEQGDFLRQEGDKRSIKPSAIAAYRGSIVDRNGVPLAVSTPVVSIWLNPKEVAGMRDQWPVIAKGVGLSANEFNSLMKKNAKRSFVYLRRHMNPDDAKLITDLKLKGIHSQSEYKRYYPAGEVAAHLVGFNNLDDHGQEGLEKTFDAQLAGKPGEGIFTKDRRGRLIDMWDVKRPAEAGEDIQLSIDLRMQYMVHKALVDAVKRTGAKGGSVVAIDIATGQLLAMANQPSFNPNNRVGLDYATVRNRAVTDLFEPGSTVKPFTVAAALTAKTFQPHTLIETTPGQMRVGNKWVRDIHNYGLIDVATVLTKSSNVGTTKIAMSLAPNYLSQFFTRVGLGVATNIGLPGERSGFVPLKNRWSDIEVATLSFGYGTTTTALQLAQAYATLGGEGLYRPLTLLKDAPSAQSQRVMDPRVAKTVSGILESVTGDEGTAITAKVPGYRVGGKTGTVHKVGDQGYAKDRYVALFAGFAPITNPKVAMVIMIDEPTKTQHFGGQAAAPVFAQAMQGMLLLDGVAMDKIGVSPAYIAQVSGL
jgi:cell division protein FtsI (penicillin-binding protein 3)